MARWLAGFRWLAGRQLPAAGGAPVAAWTLCDLPHRPTLMTSKHHTELPGFLVISKFVFFESFSKCQCGESPLEGHKVLRSKLKKEAEVKN